MESESDDTGSSVSTIIERFSRASTASSSISDYSGIHSKAGIGLDDVLQPFDMEQDMQRPFVTDAAVIVAECKQQLRPSSLDDYDDIESVSMSVTSDEHACNRPKETVQEASTKTELKNLKNLQYSLSEARTSGKSGRVTAKDSKGAGVKGQDSQQEVSEKKTASPEKGRTLSRGRSPPPTAKGRPGILKKAKGESAQKSGSSSSLQRKLAQRVNASPLSQSQTSRSTSNLCQVNSMIPKWEHMKGALVSPPPRKCRSASNLAAAVDVDSRPSLIPRPVSKTVTFAANLVKQINNPPDLLMDSEEDALEPASAGAPEAEQRADEGTGGREEAQMEERRDDLSSTANHEKVDDKTGKLPLPRSINHLARMQYQLHTAFTAALLPTDVQPLCRGVRSDSRFSRTPFAFCSRSRRCRRRRGRRTCHRLPSQPISSLIKATNPMLLTRINQHCTPVSGVAVIIVGEGCDLEGLARQQPDSG